MRVRELMTEHPEACVPWDNCGRVGEIMRRRNCGFVPVVDGYETKRVIGVVTDRDVALFLTRESVPASVAGVERCMTRNPVTIEPDANLMEAAQVMERSGVHRLPVVEDEQLVGVLSVYDLAAAARREWASAASHPLERQLLDILEAIASAQLAPSQRVRAEAGR